MEKKNVKKDHQNFQNPNWRLAAFFPANSPKTEDCSITVTDDNDKRHKFLHENVLTHLINCNFLLINLVWFN